MSPDMVDMPRDPENWTDDTALTFIAGGVGLLCDMAVRATKVDGGALVILNTPSNSRELLHATDAVAEHLDELQFLVGEGPCVDAYRRGRPITAADLDSERSHTRWPAFAREAGAVGVDAVFGYPIEDGSVPLGVLELYRHESGALKAADDDAARQYAEAIGTVLHAAADELSVRIADVASGDLARLAGSPPSRSRMHVAAGMVAEQLGVTVSEAIDRVRAHTFASGRRLGEVTADIVANRVRLVGGLDE
ncbi:GAF domain-containing protein [Mycobacterium antarcticum]|uniref:GAF domain-containing protein n=1 Tax=Mycolicibacterium sp. TUM20985 TaxID=3023370 RepID=UPI0025744075|nr:GAF domain-containing protein [Mycolicibacterium sp. TUM20985]BDX35094.1 GAF domain-containing protein [Mycolicibacterium sp. TUM20985]